MVVWAREQSSVVPYAVSYQNIKMISKLLVALVLCWGVQSFPDGAPIDTCVKERQNQPNHGQHRTQPISSLPYRVVASSMLFGPNTPITGLFFFQSLYFSIYKF